MIAIAEEISKEEGDEVLITTDFLRVGSNNLGVDILRILVTLRGLIEDMVKEMDMQTQTSGAADLEQEAQQRRYRRKFKRLSRLG
jgi:hypothetical protein